MAEFEVGKTYRTRNGKARKVIHIDPRRSSYPVVTINDLGHVFLVSRLGHLKTPTHYDGEKVLGHGTHRYTSSLDLILEELKSATKQDTETQNSTGSTPYRRR